MHNVVSAIDGTSHEIQILFNEPQALVSFKKYMPPPLPYFKVNIYISEQYLFFCHQTGMVGH
jgi:hypothetical protein